MTLRLAEFLRNTLDAEPQILVPLAAEIDMVQAYLDIEGVRFGEALQVRFACEAGLSDARVPNFILQPLVENAVKHAVAVAGRAVTVSISATRDGADLLLAVEDDGEPQADRAPTAPLGLGLRNVAARLEALYGASGRMEVGRGATGFVASLRLPMAPGV